MMNNEANIIRFEELMGKVNRPGVDQLMNYIRSSDFYTAPASTKFHLSCEGGLLQHSLNVYDCLIAKKNNPVWKKVFDGIEEESLIIMSLLHDLCKVSFYVKSNRNQKTYDADKVAVAQAWQVKKDQMGSFIWETVESYTVEDQLPLGHGEKSVMIIMNYMHLKTPEIYAIRWHMGFSEDNNQYMAIGNAMEKQPIVLALYEADMEASKLLEDIEGNRE